MRKCEYHWKELGLLSIATFSNIITFIQFAIIPLDVVNQETKTESSSGMEKIEKFITLNFGSFAKLFTAPFDFINKFNDIAAPIRVALSATAVFAIIEYLYNIFFLPSWRFLLLFCDLFIPGSFLYGILLTAKKYDEAKKDALVLIVVGIIYFVLRILYFIFPLFRKSGWTWYKKAARLTTCVFLSRIKKENPEDLDNATKEIRRQIDLREHSIQFDDQHFTRLKRYIDAGITFVIWLVNVIILIVGWKRILKKSYSGQQLTDLVSVINIVSYIIFIGMCLRVLITASWLAFPLQNSVFKIFNTLKKIAYKGMIFLTGIVLLPILKMVLNASATTDIKCNWYQFFDFRSNTDSFLQYFMKRPGQGCTNCTKYSANFVSPCNSTCYYDPKQFPLSYTVLIDSPQITETELTSVYLIPTVLLEIFYLAVFIQLLRQIYCTSLDILTYLPAPTKVVECKFQTLLNTLTSAGIGTFNTYRFKSALYYFTFTQTKLFVLFLTSLLTVIPIPAVKANAQRIIPWIFFLTSIIISASQIFYSPYVSRLHNIVNIVSYIVSGIAALLVGFHVCEIFKLPPIVGNILMIVIIAAPIITAILVPFFVNFDKLVIPTKYDLVKLQNWDSFLNKLLRFRKKYDIAKQQKKDRKRGEGDDDIDFDQDGILLQDEPSTSVSIFKPKKKNDAEERDHDTVISNFNLLKLAPIHVQEGLKYAPGETETAKNDCTYANVTNVWDRAEHIDESDFDKATDEMLATANKLLDCISYNNLMRLLNLSIIISSACLGWGLGAGVVQWKRVLGPNGSDLYVRCNAFNNGTYPAYGTY
ncbi:hypothetical protein M9Y10_021198 [Tritrichomonas musculus]|uniref:Uncharacterized protein n=1 Tax=Tritrichomonas musculus TaxID=1915356 RepID=A0ABR2HED1_9EUKA